MPVISSKGPKKPKTYRRRKSKRLITRPQLAEELGIHVETAKRWERAGKLPRPYKFGGKVAFYDREQVEKAIQESLT